MWNCGQFAGCQLESSQPANSFRVVWCAARMVRIPTAGGAVGSFTDYNYNLTHLSRALALKSKFHHPCGLVKVRNLPGVPIRRPTIGTPCRSTVSHPPARPRRRRAVSGAERDQNWRRRRFRELESECPHFNLGCISFTLSADVCDSIAPAPAAAGRKPRRHRRRRRNGRFRGPKRPRPRRCTDLLVASTGW